ncbi:MAG: hypothetical protein COA84_11020 [Robiginitomaculum sp.]|nr:MAG: hypothetical protein COA84_11020 [Robiginitomaculum sp.]
MRPFLLMLAFLGAFIIAAEPASARDKFLKSQGQQLHYREAGAYANSAEKRDIMVGVEVLAKAEQKRLLGGRPDKSIPLEVAISNNSRFRLYINAISLVDSARGNHLQILSLDDVARNVGPSGSGNKKSMRLSILRNNLTDKSLQAKVVLPGETIQGLVFVPKKKYRPGLEFHLDVQNLKRLVYLDITVPMGQ